MDIIFFSSQSEFREWLEENHQGEKELYAGFYKKATGKPSMTWSESVDQALCFGWIDGIRKSIDNERYCIRFTPRNPGSNWSKVNLQKVEDLIQKDMMQPAGLAVFTARKKESEGVYSYENIPSDLPGEYDKLFRENKDAWAFFSSQAPSWRKRVILWILSAKRKETQISRLEKLIRLSHQNKRLF